MMGKWGISPLLFDAGIAILPRSPSRTSRATSLSPKLHREIYVYSSVTWSPWRPCGVLN